MNSEDEVDTPESNMSFVLLLKDYRQIFLKSQTPSARKAKAEAYSDLQKLYEKNMGQKITTLQLLKKVNNMKTRLKNKSDINRTGNRKIVLKTWEKIFLELLEGENNNNPSIKSLPGAISAGIASCENSLEESLIKPSVSTSKRNEIVSTKEEMHELLEPINTPSTSRKSNALEEPPKKKFKNLLESYERDFTRGLTTSQLQRLVLLQQHKVLKLKETKLLAESNETNIQDVDLTRPVYLNF